MKRNWYLIWSVWLLFIAASFGILEFASWGPGGVTLSRYVWDVGDAWPLFIWLVGALTGGLAVHFFWHWSPPGSTSEG
jgi:hypothetical protein